MADTLTISRLLDLISVDGFYSLAYSFLFGMSVWVNFIGGVIAYRSLRALLSQKSASSTVWLDG